MDNTFVKPWLFVDDKYKPEEIYPTLEKKRWHHAKSSEEAIDYVEKHGLPARMSLDFLLGTDTIFTFLNWLYSVYKPKKLPVTHGHSSDPECNAKILNSLKLYEQINTNLQAKDVSKEHNDIALEWFNATKSGMLLWHVTEDNSLGFCYKAFDQKRTLEVFIKPILTMCYASGSSYTASMDRGLLFVRAKDGETVAYPEDHAGSLLQQVRSKAEKEILSSAMKERQRQVNRWGINDFEKVPDVVEGVTIKDYQLVYQIPTASAAKSTCDARFMETGGSVADILLEETIEVIEAAAEGDVEHLTEEITQVMAVCIKWLERIKQRTKAVG